MVRSALPCLDSDGPTGMTRVTSLMWLVCAIHVPIPAPAADRTSEPLRPDPRLVTARLDNGVSWIVRRHANPPGRMAVFMHVRTGSLNETEAQRGLAHFLEHMMFNGTEHFAPGELVPYFARLGMNFGADLNANTSFDRTLYQLFLPEASADEIDKALLVFRDYAFGALLTQEEIDKERGVILAEARSKKSPQQRVRDRLWPELYTGTLFAQRMPIGLEEVISRAPREQFVDYYRTWYRPENVTLLFVGDCDPATIPAIVRKHFERVPSPPAARPAAAAGFQRFVEDRALVLSDAELTTASVQLVTVLNGRLPARTVDAWRTDLVESLAIAAFNRRCDARVKRGEASYRQASASASNLFNEAISVNLTASGEPAKWAEMLAEIVRQACSARERGFRDSEVEIVKREQIAQAEQAARSDDTRSARAVISELAESLDTGAIVISPAETLGLTRKLCENITTAEVTRAFRNLYAPGTYSYVITLPERTDLPLPARERVLEIARDAWLATPESQPAQQTAQLLLADNITPGKTAKQSTEPAFQVTHASLDNGVIVHHRAMPEKKDLVLVSIALGGGSIEETPANLGVSLVAGLIPANPATVRLGSVEMRDLRAGRNLTFGGGPVADDAFVLRVSATPADLELGLTMLRAVLLEGRLERASFENWVQRTAAEIDRNTTDVDARARDAVNALLSGGDPRRLTLSRRALDALRLEAGQAWFERLTREAPMEVAIVGDVSWDAVRPLLEKYLGSLPKRVKSLESLDPLRDLSRGSGPLSRRVEVRTQTPAASVYVGFVGASGKDVDDVRALRVSAHVLTARLIRRIREELALVYGINALSTAGYIYRDAGRFYVGARCKPETAEQVSAEIEAIYRAYAEGGPTPDELAAAKKQIVNEHRLASREPQYWMELLQYFELHRRSLADVATAEAAYNSLSADQVVAAFRKYDVPARRFRVIAVPAAAPGSQPTAGSRPSTQASGH